jgi:hypothetical protein
VRTLFSFSRSMTGTTEIFFASRASENTRFSALSSLLISAFETGRRFSPSPLR